MQSLINDSRVKVIVKTYEVAVLRYSVFFFFKENKNKKKFDFIKKILKKQQLLKKVNQTTDLKGRHQDIPLT